MNISLVIDYRFVLVLAIGLLLYLRPDSIIEIIKHTTKADVKVNVKIDVKH